MTVYLDLFHHSHLAMTVPQTLLRCSTFGCIHSAVYPVLDELFPYLAQVIHSMRRCALLKDFHIPLIRQDILWCDAVHPSIHPSVSPSTVYAITQKMLFGINGFLVTNYIVIGTYLQTLLKPNIVVHRICAYCSNFSLSADSSMLPSQIALVYLELDLKGGSAVNLPYEQLNTTHYVCVCPVTSNSR